MNHPEHQLQIQIKKWVRECVACPHVFLAFDRSRKASKLQHIREAQRGLRAGTPDTVLLWEGKSLWVELKGPKTPVSTEQKELHAQMLAIGHHCRVVRTVRDYAIICGAAGVPLTQWAFARADGLDALLAAERPAPKPKKARKPRPQLRGIGTLRRAAKAGVVPV